MKYRFEKTIKVEGKKYTAGTVVEGDEIPAGCLESMLRLVQIAPYNPDAPASGFVEFMEGATLEAGKLLALPAGFTAVGPSEEDMGKAVAEIDRRGELLRDKHAALVAAGVENEALKKRVAELEAAAKPAPVEQHRLTDDGNPNPPVEPEKKTDGPPVEAKAKPPAIGPSKPPELKAGKK